MATIEDLEDMLIPKKKHRGEHPRKQQVTCCRGHTVPGVLPSSLASRDALSSRSRRVRLTAGSVTALLAKRGHGKRAARGGGHSRWVVRKVSVGTYHFLKSTRCFY